MKIITVSGYKPLELNVFNEDDSRIQFLKKAIEKRLIQLLHEGLEWVLISGQMGIEMWTAEVVLHLKKSYDINLAIIPPFENQEKRWPEAYQQKYHQLIYAADFYQTIYKNDYKGPYQFRAKDMWLVEKSNGSLLLMDEEYPGSVRYFYKVAKEAENYPIYLITPTDVDEVVEEIQMTDPDYWNSI